MYGKNTYSFPEGFGLNSQPEGHCQRYSTLDMIISKYENFKGAGAGPGQTSWEPITEMTGRREQQEAEAVILEMR